VPIVHELVVNDLDVHSPGGAYRGVALDTYLLRMFQRQVANQCFAALMAAETAQSALNPVNQDVFWASIQNCLTAVANISKAMWGQGGKYAKERKPLRDSLGVGNNSPLKRTSMRNNFEHFDERLDDWYATSTNRNHLDHMIGPPSTISGLADTDMFRVFDPTTAELVFWGKRYPLRTIMDEVLRLHPIAHAEGSKPHWDPSAPTT
jgi:hypothetical protein